MFRPDLTHHFILYSGREVAPQPPDVPFLNKPASLQLLKQTIDRVMAR